MSEDYNWYENGQTPDESAAEPRQEFENRGAWTDARYIPAGEDAVPPKYYTPQQKQPKPAAQEKTPGTAGKSCGKALGIAALCLCCVVFGAFGGAYLAEYRFADRISALEAELGTAETELAGVNLALDAVGQDVAELGDSLAEVQASVESQSTALQSAAAAGPVSGVAAGAVYELACKQVVGITTEVTYSNFFGQTSSSAVTGSGFVVSEDGYIVTNYHVIEYAYLYNYAITVIDHDGNRYTAAIVGVEEDNDLAVLKIDATGLCPVEIGDSSAIRVGDTVYAVGNPLGELDFTMTTGHVSALDRLITTDDSDVPINMFQIDAAVNSGNSGGPVYNANGELIGVVTAKYKESGVEGIGFAIPVSDASRIAAELISKGYVTGKACLGIQLDNRYTSVYSRYYGTPEGAYVYYVEEGSAAEKAGLQAGDIITAVGETEIHSGKELSAALRQYSAGETGTVTVYRAKESLELQVTFGEASPAYNRNSVY